MGRPTPSDSDLKQPASTDVVAPANAPAADVPKMAPAPTPSVSFPVVGIGASAGGLEALEEFFDNVPTDSGMAFVVVQHLSPDFKSVMDELLARRTRVPIHRVVNGMEVERNAIYLIPPKKEMIITAGKLLLSDKDPDSGLALPIDIFFRSLAADAGARAIGIILSGTGSDGSRGICEINKAGGLVIAQNPDTAKFDGMPKSAIETGIVDLILRPEQMPAALHSYGDGSDPDAVAEFVPNNPALLEGFDAIFQLLRKSYGIDFSFYKRATVSRRVQRRLQMNQIVDLDEYVERLRNDTNELNLLYKDLLIGVTKFFRDAEAFSRLEHEVLPTLFSKARGGDELRIWCAGCATGEEAYSMAILVHEQLDRMKERPSVKIFATDVHRASLNFASTGVYSEESLSHVSPERLKRFFHRAKSGYHVSQELRQTIVFAPHNLIKDAPFTKIDLITCRNLLIYFESAAQKKVLSLFHFALNSGGVVMLGPSESPGELAEEFEAIDERWRIYRKRRDKRLAPDMRLPLTTGYLQGRNLTMSPIAAPVNPPDAPLLRAYDALLKDFAPPSLLVNDRRELVQSFGGASEFLRLRDGRPTADVFELVAPDLKIPLISAVQQAATKQANVTMSGLAIKHNGEDLQLKLSVRPIADRQADRDHFLITFEKLAPRPTVDGEAFKLDLGQASRDQLQAMEQELQYTKESLQATVEEMETSNEELQATNEELVASNEELQSTNEELHSVNEELYTVNAEYQKKIVELTEMTADLDNLLQSTEVGVIFLDRDLCIRKYTRKASETFHLLPLDLGRRIDNLAHTLDRVDLVDDMKRVLREETPFETDVRSTEGKLYVLRILPYLSRGKVDGIVLTLVDIGRLRIAEESARRLSKVFLDGADPIVLEDVAGNILDVNAEAERVYGWTRDELIGKSVDLLVPPAEREKARELRNRCLEGGSLRNLEMVKLNRAGESIPVLLTLSKLSDQGGKAIGLASSAKDISTLKQAEEIAREEVRRRDQFLAILSHELRNPLGAALNATYVLDQQMDGVTPEMREEAVRVIQRQTLQAARLLDDLLDVSRITQGKIQLRRLSIDLVQLLDDAVQAVRPQIEAFKHQLAVELPTTPVLVEGDPARLLQIQENLLANAAKYTPPGGQIRLSLAVEEGEAVMRVRDNGIGIAPHMLGKIFQIFVQSEGTLDRSNGGMGLGLTLVKNLVELHGGKVAAHSDGPDQGSEFEVRLPLADRAADEHLDDRMVPQQQRHIVLVEDSDGNRHMLETLLKLAGHRVVSAKDGKQGLEMILHLRPDVAIVDIGLPEMNGFEVAQGVRTADPQREIYLIALTGYGRNEDRDASREAGFDAHLVKPLKPAELARMIETRPPRLSD